MKLLIHVVLDLLLALDTVPSHPESILHRCCAHVYVSELLVPLAQLAPEHAVRAYLQVDVRRLEQLVPRSFFKGEDLFLR